MSWSIKEKVLGAISGIGSGFLADRTIALFLGCLTAFLAMRQPKYVR